MRTTIDAMQREVEGFARRKQGEHDDARQRLALHFIAGIDLEALKRGDQKDRPLLKQRLQRLLERERQRGLRAHWSYDINRHIALKQAIDAICFKSDSQK